MKTLRLFTITLFICLKAISSYGHIDRNIFNIHINKDDEILVENSPCSINEVAGLVKEYILNPNWDYDKAEYYTDSVDMIGICKVTRAVISIQCDRGTSYDAFIQVQNQIEKAFDEMWNV